MPRLLAWLTLAVAGLAVIFVCRPTAARDDAAKALDGTEFTGRFVVLNYKQTGRSNGALLKDVGVRRLGAREFLVGEYAVEGTDGEEDWKGAKLWVPLDGVESVMVFNTFRQARDAIAARMR